MDDQNQQGQKEHSERAPCKFLRAIWAGFKSLCLWIWEWVPTHARISRFFKYAILLLALIINSKIIFDGFSYYLARRSLDAELERKTPPASIELLGVLTKRERAFVIDSLDTRCTERNQLAAFRLLDAELQPKMREAHFKSLELRSAIVVAIGAMETGHPDWSAVVDFTDLKKVVGEPNSTMSLLRDYIKPVSTATANDPKYVEASKALVEAIEKEAEPYRVKLAEYDKLRQAVREKLGKDSPDFNFVKVLEERIGRLREARKQNKDRLKDLDDVLTRYAVWTDALTGGAEDNPVLDEMAFQLGGDDRRKLQEIDCTRFEQYLQKVNGRSENLAATATTKSAGYVPRAWATISAVYREQMLGFLNSPPVGQTLFVTLFLGALGALTINALRLSKIGWWNPQPDPLWGELLLSPLLGALGAFGIFLLGSAGLLLSGDPKSTAGGATALSPFFIGMLGFVSGLLYDEAFGRVRRFGSQVFAGDTAIVVNTAEDIALADTLRAAKAASIAELVLKFGLGKRLAAESQFTLLVPSDDAMGRLTLADWREISEARTRPKFDNWLRRHHAPKRTTKGDVSAAPAEIQMDDNTKYPMLVENDVLKVGGIAVSKADISHGNGIIHILEGDLPKA
jgi:uncharacterized surface protein with fasciclin (FAS1) repeats